MYLSLICMLLNDVHFSFEIINGIIVATYNEKKFITSYKKVERFKQNKEKKITVHCHWYVYF